MLTAKELQNLLPEFINHLISNNSSRSTIKNYASDLRRLIDNLPADVNLTSFHFTEAFKELKGEFSESTIRRFSFSLKAFSGWLSSKGYELQAPAVIQSNISNNIVTSPVEAYVSHIKTEGASESTSRQYKSDLSTFFSWLRPNNKELTSNTLAKVNRFDINRYTSFLKSKQVSSATINRYLYSLRSFFNFQKEDIVYRTNPVTISAKLPGDKKTFWQKLRPRKPRWWHAYRGHPASDYVNWTALAVLTLLVGLSVYSKYYAPKQIDLEALKNGLVLGSAAPPRVLSFQGRLTNNSGTPIITATNVVFKIYDARTAGNLKWTSKTWSVTPDQNGIFSVCLGGQDTTDDCLLNGVADTAIPANLFTDNPSLYLGLTVGADSEATPRQRIASSTYALNSAALNSSFSSATNNDFGNSISLTNANTSASVITINGLSLTPNGTNNSNGGANNISNVLLFNSPLTPNSNLFYGLNFNTGYTDILRYNGTQLISGTGSTGAGLTLALGSSSITGTLGLSNGGTNNNITAANGQVAYSDTSKLVLTTGGSTGNCLQYNSASAPTWGSCAIGSGTAVLLAPSGAQADSTTNSSINISKIAVGSLINLSQTSAVTSTYSTSDISLTRGLTSSTASINNSGNFLNIVNSTNFSGAGATNAPTEILITNPTPTGGAIFTGNFIDLKRADTAGGAQVSKFSVSASGSLDFTTYKKLIVVVEGDSISDTNVLPTNWAVQFTAAESPYFAKATLSNYAATAERSDQMVAEYSTEAYTKRPVNNGDEGWFFLMGGINDINQNYATPATIYNNLKSLWASARADKFKVVAFTVLPVSFFTGGQETDRQTLNNLIMSDTSLYDYLIRADIVIPDPTNTTYYGDGIHPTAAGSKKIADTAETVISYKPWLLIPNTAYTTTPTNMSLLLNPTGGNVGIGLTSTSAPIAGLDIQKAITAASGVAYGTRLQQTLTAVANSDALSSLYINPTFTNGAFAPITNNGISINTPTVTGSGTVTKNALNVGTGWDNILSGAIANLTNASAAGVSITNGSTTTSGTVTALSATVASAGTGTTQNGLLVTPPSSTGAGTTNGLNIGTINTNSSTGVENAISVGGGWDNAFISPFGGFGRSYNYLTYSEAFANSVWTKTNVTTPTADTIVAPNNDTSAEVLTSTLSGGNVQQQRGTLSAATGGKWTFSVWLKTASGTVTSRLRMLTSTGTASGFTNTFTVNTTWQRFYITGTYGTDAATNVIAQITPVDSGTGTIHAWGAQLDFNADVPSIYIRTDQATAQNSEATGNETINSSLVASGTFKSGANAAIGSGSSLSGQIGLDLGANLFPGCFLCSTTSIGLDIANNLAANGTLNNGIHIFDTTLTSGVTAPSTNVGIDIDAQTVGSSSDYGIRIAAADTAGISLTSVSLGSTGLLGTLASSNTGTTTGVGITTGTISSGTQNAFLATLTATSAGTLNGLNISPSGSFGATTVTGINIGAITDSGATSTAIGVGSGWDNILSGAIANLTNASAAGVSITNGSTTTSGTVTALSATVASAGTGTTQNGLLVTPPSSTGAGTTNGINITGIATPNSSGSETAIKVEGGGWDNVLSSPMGGFGRTNENRIKYSEDFGTTGFGATVWTATNTTYTANSTTAPDNSSNADTLAPTTAAIAYVEQQYNLGSSLSGITYTFSVWLKAGSATTSKIEIRDFTAGTSCGSSTPSATSTWQRFSVTCTFGGTNQIVAVRIYPDNSNSTGTVFAWGAQLEATGAPSLYSTTSNGTSGIGSSGASVNGYLRAGGWAQVGSGSSSFGIPGMGASFIGLNLVPVINNFFGLAYAQLTSANLSSSTTNLESLRIENPTLLNSSTATNNYGIHVLNQTAGTTDYAILIDGADTAGICFDCDGTYSFSTVSGGLQWGTNSTTSQNLRLYRSNGAAAAQITIDDGAGTVLIQSNTTTTSINLSAQVGGTAQRLCHNGADAATGVQQIGDCGATQADLAEYFGVNYGAEAADLVVLDGEATEATYYSGATSIAYVKKSSAPYEKNLIGVVSTNPSGEVLGESSKTLMNNPKPVALVGRVPLKVSSENGPIEPGDPLTSSSLPGVAMKATRAGYIIGRALASFNGYGVGKVIVFVNTQYADPERISQTEAGINLDFVNQTTDSAKLSTSSAKLNLVALNLFGLDSDNNLIATISAGTKFIWKNSAGQLIAWVSDTGAAFFNSVTAALGDFSKLVFGEAVVKKDAKTAGESSFAVSETEVFIESDKVKADSLINLTPTSKRNGVSLYIKEKKPGEGFVVALERNSGDQPTDATASASQAIKFTWFILNQE